MFVRRIVSCPMILLHLCLPFAGVGYAQSGGAAGGFADHGAIDRMVEGFTGQRVGEVGGAREPVDRRLRLRVCDGPPQLDWYGEPGRSVQVSCPDAGGWRIYVNLLRPAPSARTPAKASISDAVKRGDTINVMIKGRGFSVQKQGQAEEAGTIGEWIEIRTGKASAPVRAQIIRPGLAEITLE